MPGHRAGGFVQRVDGVVLRRRDAGVAGHERLAVHGAGAVVLGALFTAAPPLVQAATTQAAAAQAVPRAPPITTFRM